MAVSVKIVTIRGGQSLSSYAQLTGTLLGVILPGGWDYMREVGFQISDREDGPYYKVYDWWGNPVRIRRVRQAGLYTLPSGTVEIPGLYLKVESIAGPQSDDVTIRVISEA